MINFKFISLLATIIGSFNIFLLIWFIVYFRNNKSKMEQLKRIEERETERLNKIEQKATKRLEDFYKKIIEVVTNKSNEFNQSIKEDVTERKELLNKLNDLIEKDKKILNKQEELNNKIETYNKTIDKLNEELKKYRGISWKKENKIDRLIKKLKILNPNDKDVIQHEKKQQKEKERLLNQNKEKGEKENE